MPTLTTTIQHSFESFSHSNQRKKKKRKGIQIGKEEVKLSLFADGMILYIGNPEDITRKFLELINEYSKVAGCKINKRESLAFLYKEKTKKAIKETITFTIATKRINYLGINLSKGSKDLYIENYKIYHVHGSEEST